MNLSIICNKSRPKVGNWTLFSKPLNNIFVLSVILSFISHHFLLRLWDSYFFFSHHWLDQGYGKEGGREGDRGREKGERERILLHHFPIIRCQYSSSSYLKNRIKRAFDWLCQSSFHPPPLLLPHLTEPFSFDPWSLILWWGLSLYLSLSLSMCVYSLFNPGFMGLFRVQNEQTWENHDPSNERYPLTVGEGERENSWKLFRFSLSLTEFTLGKEQRGRRQRLLSHELLLVSNVTKDFPLSLSLSMLRNGRKHLVTDQEGTWSQERD